MKKPLSEVIPSCQEVFTKILYLTLSSWYYKVPLLISLSTILPPKKVAHFPNGKFPWPILLLNVGCRLQQIIQKYLKLAHSGNSNKYLNTL